MFLFYPKINFKIERRHTVCNFVTNEDMIPCVSDWYYQCGGYPVDRLMNIVTLLLWYSMNMMFDSINSYRKVTKSCWALRRKLRLNYAKR